MLILCAEPTTFYITMNSTKLTDKNDKSVIFINLLQMTEPLEEVTLKTTLDCTN